MKTLYETNLDFRTFVDRYMAQYPGKALEEILQHKIVINTAEYYKKGGKNIDDYITIKN